MLIAYSHFPCQPPIIKQQTKERVNDFLESHSKQHTVNEVTTFDALANFP